MRKNISDLLKTTFKKFKSNPFYSLILIIGFAIGISATLLIYLWINKEKSYDKFHSDYNRIYRVLSLTKEGPEVIKSANSNISLAKDLKENFPQIEKATFLRYDSEDTPLYRDNEIYKIEARQLFVNIDFFYIFDGFKFLEGNINNIINSSDGIILSHETAQKLFGNRPALGQTIISDKYRRNTYNVVGVMDIPNNTHINFDYIIVDNKINSNLYESKSNYQLSYHSHTYIKLSKDAVIDDKFKQEITNYITHATKSSDKLLFQNLADIHLYSDYRSNTYDKDISDYKNIWIFSVLSLLIIFMSSFNFTMLETARSTDRFKEIGVKKVNGANQKQLIYSSISHSILESFIAGIIAIILILILLPLANKYLHTDIYLIYSLEFIIKFLIFLVVIGILAGLYPAIYTASFKPTFLLKGSTKTGSRKYFIQALLLIQFTITIFFLISTFLVIKQLNFIQNKDLGLDQSDIVVIPTGLWYDNQQFKNEVLKNPNILSVSASAFAPVDYKIEFMLPIKHDGIIDSIKTYVYTVDEDFAKTYNLEIVEGHFFDFNFSQFWKEFEKDKNELVSIPIAINETAQKIMGFDNPIGQRIGNYVIVGVVKDFNFQPLHNSIGPVILLNDPENIMTTNIKISPTNTDQTLSFIRDTYRKYRNERDFNYYFFDDLLREKYKREIRFKNLLLFLSITAIIISVFGLIGISIFFIQQKIKEIGIRKINGATIMQVMLLINKQFIWTVAIAFVLATLIAYYAMNKWLENFAYKTALSWWIFALAGLSALVIALLTVSWQSYRAAAQNPVEALRNE